MKKILLVMALVMTMMQAQVTGAAATSIDLPTTPFAISKLGDVTIVLEEGVPHAIVARGQKFAAYDIYFSVNGVSYLADAFLASNLTLQRDTMPLKFDHDGTFKFKSGEDMLILEYEGVADKTKDMEMHTKTLNSYGSFVVTEGTGVFADLEGVMGTYSLKLVCRRMPGEHPKVGDPVEVSFSAMSE
jgi:hypothetical protein